MLLSHDGKKRCFGVQPGKAEPSCVTHQAAIPNS
jgi:hypothetical protein